MTDIWEEASCAQRKYEDLNYRSAFGKTTFRPVPCIYIDRPPLAVAAADHMAPESYSKFFPLELGVYHILSSPTATVTNDKEGILSIKLPDRALFPR